MTKFQIKLSASLLAIIVEFRNLAPIIINIGLMNRIINKYLTMVICVTVKEGVVCMLLGNVKVGVFVICDTSGAPIQY